MTIAFLLALSGGLAFAGTAGAHEESGVGAPCDEGDIPFVSVTAPEVTYLWGNSTCSQSQAHCGPEESTGCSDPKADEASADSYLTCDGSTHTDGHVHCSAGDGSGGDDDSKLKQIGSTAEELPLPDKWQEVYKMLTGTEQMTTAVGIWGTTTGYVCSNGHCHAFEPVVTTVPSLLPYQDDHTIVSTPW